MPTTRALRFAFALVIALTPLRATELNFWPGKHLAAGEQVVCIAAVSEQQFHGGMGDTLFIKFDKPVEGSVSLNGGTIAEFKFESQTKEIHFSGRRVYSGEDHSDRDQVGYIDNCG